MMNKNSVKSLLLFLFETALIASVSLVLFKLDLHDIANFFVYLVLFTEILWALRFTYKNDNTNTKIMAVVSAWLIFAFYMTVMITKMLMITIPNVFVTAYLLLQGYLILTGCINMAKRSKSNAKFFIALGSIFYVLTALSAFFGVFGIVK